MSSRKVRYGHLPVLKCDYLILHTHCIACVLFFTAQLLKSSVCTLELKCFCEQFHSLAEWVWVIGAGRAIPAKCSSLVFPGDMEEASCSGLYRAAGSRVPSQRMLLWSFSILSGKSGISEKLCWLHWNKITLYPCQWVAEACLCV